MDAIESEYAAMRKRHQKATVATDDAIEHIESVLLTLKVFAMALEHGHEHTSVPPLPSPEDYAHHNAHEHPDGEGEEQDPEAEEDEEQEEEEEEEAMDVDSTALPALPQLRHLLKLSKGLQASLVLDHKSVGAAMNKLGRAIDAATAADLGALCAPSVRLNTAKVNDAVAAHLFREGLFDIGRTFVVEASVLLDDRLIRPFERLYHMLTAFRRRQLTPAIEWTREQKDVLEGGEEHLQFRLHRLAYLQILEGGDRGAALEYARMHFAKFPKHIKTVQKLMTCLLYASRLHDSPYKDMVSAAHRDDIERALSREYCRAQGLNQDSSLVTVIRCGTKAIPMLLKASRVAPNLHELGMDDALPVEIDVGRECQFHSIFTCPVSKEEASEGNNMPMILPCGHVLSNQSVKRLPRGSNPRFKCPYCPMEQSHAECRELRF